jgi:uncharacterized protein YqgC (DUF456 family)
MLLAMLITLAILLTLINAALLLLAILGLPGPLLMVTLTWLVAWWQWDAAFIGMPTLIAITLLFVLGEALEFLSGVWGAKKFGGSNRAAIGAAVGTLVGGILGTVLIPLPVAGTLIGAVGGAAIGAMAVETYRGEKLRPTLMAGTGAGVGRLTGTVLRLACGVVMWLLISVAAFWP